MFCLDSQTKNKGTAVALGYFDGIHLGHRAVLMKALERARVKNLVPVVMLFDIHPRKLISGKIPPMLTTESDKRDILLKMGFEVVDFDFKKAMNYTPEQFIDEILIGQLNAKSVTCGYDYHYGKGGKGSAETLESQLSRLGVEVFAQMPVLLDAEAISSTAIRELISKGDIKKANRMLGNAFTYDFPVEKGDRIGRTIGFPTINQFFPEDFIVPKYGVYASVVTLYGKTYPAVTNVGVRPTVEGTASMRSETCIMDFSGDLYGKNVKVSLMEYIRDEKKFSSLDGLAQQISKDIVKAREIYNEVMKNG